MFQGTPYIINASRVIILVIATLTFAVATAQLTAIYQGLAQMKQASKERDAQLARQAEHLQNQDRENQRRHEQAMAALTALLERIDRRGPEPSMA